MTEYCALYQVIEETCRAFVRPPREGGTGAPPERRRKVRRLRTPRGQGQGYAPRLATLSARRAEARPRRGPPPAAQAPRRAVGSARRSYRCAVLRKKCNTPTAGCGVCGRLGGLALVALYPLALATAAAEGRSRRRKSGSLRGWRAPLARRERPAGRRYPPPVPQGGARAPETMADVFGKQGLTFAPRRAIMSPRAYGNVCSPR